MTFVHIITEGDAPEVVCPRDHESVAAARECEADYFAA